MKKNLVTIILVILNITAFILCTILGEVVYNIGSLSVVDIIDGQEYYRLISCMFLHGDIDHIFGNILFLFALGDMLEKAIGHGRFLLIYMLSGIGSGLFSVAYELISGHYYHSVGASGAIFGLIGALLVIVIKNNGSYEQISLRRMIFAIVYMVYTGLRSPITNNAAHIGGLVIGFIIMLIMYVKGSRQKL